MRISQNDKLLKIKQHLSTLRADLLNLSAAIWMDDEEQDKGIPDRIEKAEMNIQKAVEVIRAITAPVNPLPGEKETK